MRDRGETPPRREKRRDRHSLPDFQGIGKRPADLAIDRGNNGQAVKSAKKQLRRFHRGSFGRADLSARVGRVLEQTSPANRYSNRRSATLIGLVCAYEETSRNPCYPTISFNNCSKEAHFPPFFFTTRVRSWSSVTSTSPHFIDASAMSASWTLLAFFSV